MQRPDQLCDRDAPFHVGGGLVWVAGVELKASPRDPPPRPHCPGSPAAFEQVKVGEIAVSPIPFTSYCRVWLRSAVSHGSPDSCRFGDDIKAGLCFVRPIARLV